jgi:putative flippase GtrA
MIKKLFQKVPRSLVLFLIIGAGNTVLSWALMFLFYNAFSLSYWTSSFLAFLIASISSFYFNKKYSFQSHSAVSGAALRFVVVILSCYFIGWGVAKPLVIYCLKPFPVFSVRLAEQVALIIGNIIFTALNYFGQRYFAFKD